MNWEFETAWEYFDNREKNCICEYSQEYGNLSLDERSVVDVKIHDSIVSWLDRMKESTRPSIIEIACSIVDDTYRSANKAYYYPADVVDYLGITARTVMNWYTDHGIQIHYLTHNTFSEYVRPLQVFPYMYKKSGLLYICPQHLAWLAMEKEGISFEHFKLYYGDYETGARDLANDLIERSCKTGQHYIHLDIDGDTPCFEKEFEYADKPGHILIFREEDPAQSAKIKIFYQ